MDWVQSRRLIAAGPGRQPSRLVRVLAEDVLAESPDIAIVLLGGNDAGRHGPCHARTRDSLAQSFPGFKCGNQNAGITVSLLVNPASSGTAWGHLTENNELIGELAISIER